MKLGLNPFVARYPQNSVSFQSGEFNHLFDKRLSMATDNSSDAQALLRCVREDTITFSQERFEQVTRAAGEAAKDSARFYLNKIIEVWKKLAK